MNALEKFTETLEKFAEIVRIENPKDIQVAGDHYKNRKIEPLDFLQEVAEVYGYTIASACKYILRYKNKGQYQSDLLKIAHYAQLSKTYYDSYRKAAMEGGNPLQNLSLTTFKGKLDRKLELTKMLPDLGIEPDSRAAMMFDFITRFAEDYAVGNDFKGPLNNLFHVIRQELLSSPENKDNL